MKSLSIFITATLLISGFTTGLAQNNSNEEKLVMHPIPKTEQNPFGMQMPLPENWIMNPNAPVSEPFITAPGGVKVYDYPRPQNFIFSDDSLTLKYYTDATGITSRQSKGIDGIIETDLKPFAENSGYHFLTQYPLMDNTMNIAAFTVQLYNPLHLNNLGKVVGTEWTDKYGNMLLIVVEYTETVSLSDIMSWGYSAHSLQTSKEEFEKAKAQYLYGLANLEYNPDDIKAYNKAQEALWNEGKEETNDPSDYENEYMPNSNQK